jgi:hypothetical protein
MSVAKHKVIFISCVAMCLICFILTGVLTNAKASNAVIGFFGFLAFASFCIAFITGVIILTRYFRHQAEMVSLDRDDINQY